MPLAPWYVAETQRHKERAAQACLLQFALEAYVPLLRQWPRPAVGSEIGPLFPGYLFVRATPRDHYRISHTPYVRGLVAFSGQPAPLDESVIAFLRSRQGPDGIIRYDPVPAGYELAITDGPLRGLGAVLERRISGRQRVLVLLELLQRETRVEMPERWVRRA